MRVNIKFTDDFTRNLKVELAKELIGIHKQVLVRKFGEIPENKAIIFEDLLAQLDKAKPDDLIDFSVLGDIEFQKGN